MGWYEVVEVAVRRVGAFVLGHLSGRGQRELLLSGGAPFIVRVHCGT